MGLGINIKKIRGVDDLRRIVCRIPNRNVRIFFCIIGNKMTILHGFFKRESLNYLVEIVTVIARMKELEMTEKQEQWVVGQKFDDYLKEQGVYEETIIQSEIEFLIEQIQEKMKSEKFSKEELCNFVLAQLGQIGQKFDVELGSQ